MCVRKCVRVRYTIKSSPRPTFTRPNACLFGPLFVFELKHLEQKLHSVNAKIQAKVHLYVFKVETETGIQAKQMTWAARSPLPYSTTKSLLWVMCWLGDNWQVWKKGWHLWGHADINVTILKNPWQWPAAINKEKEKKRNEKELSLQDNFLQEEQERVGKWKRWTGTQSNQLFFVIYDYQAQLIPLRFCFSSSQPSSLTCSLHHSAWLGWCNRGPAQLCNFIRVYFTGIFLSILFPRTFPLTLFCISSTTICCL